MAFPFIWYAKWPLSQSYSWSDAWICLIRLLIGHNHSVKKGRVFLGWTSTKQGLMNLAQGHKAVMLTRPLSLESSTVPLSHWAPYQMHWLVFTLPWHKAWSFLMFWLIFFNNCFLAGRLILCMLVNCRHLLTFSKLGFFPPKLGILSDSLDPDQDWQNVSPDLGPNCL